METAEKEIFCVPPTSSECCHVHLSFTYNHVKVVRFLHMIDVGTGTLWRG